MQKEVRRATIAALAGNAVFGFSFMFSRIALGVASPFVMLTYRFLFAFIGLTVLAVWSAVTGRGREYHPNLTPSPATIKPPINISPDSFTTRSCSRSFSFALSLLLRSAGFFIIITIPAANIGINKIPIKSHPFQ